MLAGYSLRKSTKLGDRTIPRYITEVEEMQVEEQLDHVVVTTRESLKQDDFEMWLRKDATEMLSTNSLKHNHRDPNR